MLTVIIGPPCSGKTHHARTHARPGDVVIDLDAIATALTVTDDEHVRPAHITAIARRARRAAMQAALPMSDRVDVWLIDSAPTTEARRWYHMHGARFVRLTVTHSEFEARVAERSPAAQDHARALVGANVQVRGERPGGGPPATRSHDPPSEHISLKLGDM